MFRNSEHSNKVIDSDIRSQKEGPKTLKKEILVVKSGFATILGAKKKNSLC